MELLQPRWAVVLPFNDHGDEGPDHGSAVPVSPVRSARRFEGQSCAQRRNCKVL